jgi:hypothetical protein
MPRTPAAAFAAAILLALPAAAQTPPRAPPAAPSAPAPSGLPSAPPSTPMAPPGVIYTMEILQTLPLSPDMAEKLKPLKTLQDIEALFKANHVPFTWRWAEAPSSQIPAALAQRFDANPTDVFVFPQAGGVVFAAIVNRRHV